MQRLLLVDDDSELLDALAEVLAARGFVPTTFSAASPAIAALRAGLVVDVALLDLGLPDLSGVQVVRAVRTHCPEAVPLVFTIQEDAPSVFEALRAGVRGYLLKSTRFERLAELIGEAQSGGVPMSPAVARYLVEALPTATSDAEEEKRFDALTRRERDVLALLARGLSYADVASNLHISLGTVQVHVKHLYGKLEIASKAEAAALATKLGWV